MEDFYTVFGILCFWTLIGLILYVGLGGHVTITL